MTSRRRFVAGALTALGGGSYWLIRSGRVPVLMRHTTLPRQVRLTGGVREYLLEAKASEWSPSGGVAAKAWTYNGTVPGPEIRVTEGETLRVTLHNLLDEPTSIHWHGLPVPFAMDGVPDLTQPAVPPGGTFVYEFKATRSGTYWYHTHFGYQLDRGLYGALIVQPAQQELRYDQEYTLVLDDWLNDPDHPRPDSLAGGMMMGMGMGGMMGGMLGGLLLGGLLGGLLFGVQLGCRQQLQGVIVERAGEPAARFIASWNFSSRMRSRSFIELNSCEKICSRTCFCLSSPFTISSNEASGLAFSSCEIMAPVCESIVNVASQQGQMIVNRVVSAM